MNATQGTGLRCTPVREILVVDDDAAVRESIAEALEAAGYVAVRASDGVDALGHLRTSGVPGLVLVDLMMPKLNGWELCDIVRRDPALASVPILVISAAEQFDREAVHIGGIVGSLGKPIDVDALVRRVAEIVDGEDVAAATAEVA
jgi:CheY-like chemotaxis protein